ncbi:hypothetical protein SAMN05192563_105235 [Paraburkholderia aspalathi]|uniref:Uncharacterized protein n=2 Tax=Paraburkholderia aspalathi TaxID=1324617 RepID=A0A1I7EQZ9_9BURK|nr:hypothetical protein SAMN05192563_105235 [Paraburkholderia aspalathi]
MKRCPIIGDGPPSQLAERRFMRPDCLSTLWIGSVVRYVDQMLLLTRSALALTD